MVLPRRRASDSESAETSDGPWPSACVRRADGTAAGGEAETSNEESDRPGRIHERDAATNRQPASGNARRATLGSALPLPGKPAIMDHRFSAAPAAPATYARRIRACPS